MTEHARSAPGETRAAPEPKRLLVAVLGAPVAWVIHLFVVYALVGIECNGDLSDALYAGGMALATLGLAGAALGSGLLGWRMLRPGVRSSWRLFAAPAEERGQFLAGTGVLLAAVFLLLIVLEGVSPLIAPSCPELFRMGGVR